MFPFLFVIDMLPGAQTIKIPYVFSDVGKFIRIIHKIWPKMSDYQQV